MRQFEPRSAVVTSCNYYGSTEITRTLHNNIHTRQFVKLIVYMYDLLCTGPPLGNNMLAYTEVVYTNCSFGTWVPGRYIAVGLYSGWPLRGVPLYCAKIKTLLTDTVYSL